MTKILGGRGIKIYYDYFNLKKLEQYYINNYALGRYYWRENTGGRGCLFL